MSPVEIVLYFQLLYISYYQIKKPPRFDYINQVVFTLSFSVV